MDARTLITTLALAVLLTSCRSADEERLERTVDWTRNTLEQVNTDVAASLSYSGVVDMGGGALDYVMASMPEDPDFSRFEPGHTPTRPWTVVIVQDPRTGDVAILGYGKDLASPLHEEHVRISPVSARF